MKHLWLCIALVFIIGNINAQETKVFNGGAFAGISASQLSGDQLSGYKKAGICAGAFVNIHFTPKSALQLELSYIQKGSRSVSKNWGLIYHVNLQYVEIPVLYKWQFHKRFGLEVGPATGFLMKRNNIERDYSGIWLNRTDFNLIDLSAIAGVSVGIVEHLKFDFRFSQSVLPIRKHSSGAVYRLNRGQYNSVVAFTLVLEY